VIQPYVPGSKVACPQDSSVVLVGGCFDILHYGHIQFLEKAKACGDFLVVALEPDQTIIAAKKRFPVHGQHERALNLSALRSVDLVLTLPVLKGFQDYSQLSQDVRPSIIAITEGDPQLDNKQLQADQVTARLEIVIPQMGEYSSSRIYKTMANMG